MSKSYFKSEQTLINYLKQRKIIKLILLNTIKFEYRLNKDRLEVRYPGKKNPWNKSWYTLTQLFKHKPYK